MDSNDVLIACVKYWQISSGRFWENSFWNLAFMLREWIIFVFEAQNEISESFCEAKIKNGEFEDNSILQSVSIIQKTKVFFDVELQKNL